VNYDSESGDFVVALTGESLIVRPMRQFREPRFLDLVAMLRDADVTFTNAEMLFHDYEGFPREESKGTYMRAAPEIAGELRWMGIDLAATANNHAYDFLTEGVLANRRNLEKHGLVVAGTGENLTAARAPGYFDSPRGLVGLVASTDDLNVLGGRAGEARPDMKGRPGANYLRVALERDLDDRAFEDLRELDRRIGYATERDQVREGRFPGERYAENDDQFYFGPTPEAPAILYRRSDQTRRASTIVDAEDWAATLRSIRDARETADWVIFSHHNGYSGDTGDDPADHFVAMAHEAIDNGADIVVGHGPHRDRGIELYDGKPIFYSLGNFIQQTDTIPIQAADAFARFGLDWSATTNEFYNVRSRGRTVAQETRPDRWLSFVPVLRWTAHTLTSIEVYPVSLGLGATLGQRGRPVFAGAEERDVVLENLRRASKRFGTTIESADGRGVIRAG
jgi:poly-gamma-glutamate capsule biosynthesis protein CapA/YwtB (metallophosphatase superfamily)